MKRRNKQVRMSEQQYMDMLVQELHGMGGKATIQEVDGIRLSYAGFNHDEWVDFYGDWFDAEFTERLGYAPTEDSVQYALEKYAEVSKR